MRRILEHTALRSLTAVAFDSRNTVCTYSSIFIRVTQFNRKFNLHFCFKQYTEPLLFKRDKTLAKSKERGNF
jgi:hypothetical protein